MDGRRENGYLWGEENMNRLKRVADFLEKLAVTGIALAVFQNNFSGMGWAVVFFIVSLVLTKEAK